jgi:hypothetical protein
VSVHTKPNYSKLATFLGHTRYFFKTGSDPDFRWSDPNFPVNFPAGSCPRDRDQTSLKEKPKKNRVRPQGFETGSDPVFRGSDRNFPADFQAGSWQLQRRHTSLKKKPKKKRV